MATVPTPTTQTAGTVVAAATINSQGNLATYLAGRTESGGARRPLAVLKQGTPQSLSTGVATAVLFDAEDVDYDNGHSTVSNTSRYTANTAGYYLATWSIGFTANATGYRQTYLRYNGTTQVATSSGVGTSLIDLYLTGSTHIFLNATDYIEIIAAQSSGGGLNLTAARFTLQWVSV